MLMPRLTVLCQADELKPPTATSVSTCHFLPSVEAADCVPWISDGAGKRIGTGQAGGRAGWWEERVGTCQCLIHSIRQKGRCGMRTSGHSICSRACWNYSVLWRWVHLERFQGAACRDKPAKSSCPGKSPWHMVPSNCLPVACRGPLRRHLCSTQSITAITCELISFGSVLFALYNPVNPQMNVILWISRSFHYFSAH